MNNSIGCNWPSLIPLAVGLFLLPRNRDSQCRVQVQEGECRMKVLLCTAGLQGPVADSLFLGGFSRCLVIVPLGTLPDF